MTIISSIPQLDQAWLRLRQNKIDHCYFCREKIKRNSLYLAQISSHCRIESEQVTIATASAMWRSPGLRRSRAGEEQVSASPRSCCQRWNWHLARCRGNCLDLIPSKHAKKHIAIGGETQRRKPAPSEALRRTKFEISTPI
jgi:hypothetical protein